MQNTGWYHGVSKQIPGQDYQMYHSLVMATALPKTARVVNAAQSIKHTTLQAIHSMYASPLAP